jgi:CheY-like chemotaxis protein
MFAHPIQSRRVVLVEDDAVLQKHVASTLHRSFCDLDVRGAKDASEALRLLEDERSCMLITDAQHHHLDAMALAASARKFRPGLPVIVMSSAPEPHMSRLPLSAAAWLEKPPQVERLVGLVEHMLAIPVGFSGALSIDGLADLVQLLSMANISGALYIEHGAERGTVWFDRGAIVDAALNGTRGSTGFHRMLRWQGGVFALDRQACSELHTIHVPTMQLLLEALQFQDEERAGSAAQPVSETSEGENPEALGNATRSSQTRLKPLTHARLAATQLQPPPAAGFVHTTSSLTLEQRAAESFQRGMELALHKQYGAALREWERATTLDPSNHTYQVNLRRLNEVRRRNAAMGGTHGDEE